MQTQAYKSADVFRHEVKYYLSPRDAFFLAQYFRRTMRVDPHAGADGKYWVRSVYFDTASNRDYYDKLIGCGIRRKIRLRIYDVSAGSAILERKSKRDAFVHKKSVRLGEFDAIKLLNNDYAFLGSMQSTIAESLYSSFCHEQLRPVILIDYSREAFELPFENIRITIDRKLQASTDVRGFFDKNLPCIDVLDGMHCILEVKYRYAIPDYLRSLLSEIGPTNSSISKYVISRQTLLF